MLRKKVIYKLRLFSKKNRLGVTNSYQPIHNTYTISKKLKKFTLTNNLIKSRRPVNLSSEGAKFKGVNSKFTVRKKKTPNPDKTHFNLVSNLYDHLLNRFSLLTLKRVNYNKSGFLRKTKYAFFKNTRFYEIPHKLSKFLGAVDKDSRLALKKKLFLKDLLSNTATRD